MSARKELLAFCLIILLAALLRFSGICFDSLWLDEGYQSLVGAAGHAAPQFMNVQPTNSDLSTAPRLTGSETFLFRFEKPAELEEMLRNFRKVDPLCPPLYALLLNRWITLFGDTDLTLRSLSAIISTASVFSLMLAARCLIGPRAALLAGLLQAVSAFDIHYAQEARMYSLVVLTALVSGGSLLCILKTELSRKIHYLLLPLYAVSTWAMVNSHYTALFLAATEGFATCAYLVITRRWRLFGMITLAWISTALMCLPWLPMFLQSAGSRKESFYVARVPDLIWPFKAFTRIPINWLVFLSGQRVIAYAMPLYLSSASMLLASFCCLFKRLQKKPADQQSPFSIFALWLWALLPALGIWLVDLLENHKVVEVARYLIFTSPAIFMLAGAGLSLLSQKKKLFVTLLGAHLLFAGVNLSYTHSVHQREPWREMATKVEEMLPVDKPLIVSQFYNIACLDRYLTKPRLQIGSSPNIGADVVRWQLLGLDSFALLTAQEGEAIKDMIPPEFKLTKQVDLSHGLHLRLFERDPSATKH